MADQSTLQQLLQQGVGLQSNAQGNTTLTPNNGNPNTIYNLARPNVTQFNPATGALPAMGDANGNWAVPAQGLNPALQQILSNNVQQTNVRPTVPAGMFTIPPVIIPGLPGPTAPPITAPVSGPGTGTPVAGGGGTNTGGNLSAISAGGTGGGTGIANQTHTGNYLGGTPPVGSFPNAFTGGAVDKGAGYGMDFGGNNVNWQQIVDVAGDAMGLPGNWYLSNDGGWDVSNILTSLGSTVTGLPIGNLLQQLGQKVANSPNGVPLVPAWLERAALSHYMDNTQNSLTGSLTNAQQQMMNKIAGDTKGVVSQTAADAMRKLGLDPRAGQYTGPTGYTAGRTPGSVAGAGSIGGTWKDANGNTHFDTAGQDMFAGMKLSSLARGTRQTGGDMYGRAYEK